MVLHYIPESGILTGIMHLIPLQDGLVFLFFFFFHWEVLMDLD